MGNPILSTTESLSIHTRHACMRGFVHLTLWSCQHHFLVQLFIPYLVMTRTEKRSTTTITNIAETPREEFVQLFNDDEFVDLDPGSMYKLCPPWTQFTWSIRKGEPCLHWGNFCPNKDMNNEKYSRSALPYLSVQSTYLTTHHRNSVRSER